MPGTITKINIIRNFRQIVKMGGLELVVAVVRAKPGVPFLTVFFEVENNRYNRTVRNMLK